MQPNGSAFSGVAQPCTAPAEAWDSEIVPPAIGQKRCHVRCNGLLGGVTTYRPRLGLGDCKDCCKRTACVWRAEGQPGGETCREFTMAG